MNFISFTIGTATAAPQNWLMTVVPGLIVAVVAGVLLFFLNWLREYLTARWKKESEAEVLAFALVSQLDKLISECSYVVDDPLEEDRETGEYESTVDTPDIQFPESWNWAAFPKKLQYQIRSLPNKIDVANRAVTSNFEYGEGPPYYGDAFQEREIRYAWIGLEACLINDQLAEKYGVPLLERGAWDPAETFKAAIEKVTKQREEAEAMRKNKPSFLLPKVPIEELRDRHTKLTADLEAAEKRRAAR
ncbi:hypothetical protein [Rhizobium ruizarguesonis]|uniref:hypothetical protein n=1 Tax=Rhizobium ruizarguesonis TaxID=2081791 RepID=UPI001FE07F68|nr:hypothetical protein [Rhizobium ruizarguesonis]